MNHILVRGSLEMTWIKTFLRSEWELTALAVGLALLFLPMHTHGPDELWAIVRMAWWIASLLCVNEFHKAYKEKKAEKLVKLMWVRPEPNAWVNRWGVSWRTLGIVVPIMSVAFFFVMLVVFA